MENKPKTHFKFNGAELYSNGYFNYFGNNGSLYIIKSDILTKILFEIELKRPAEQLQIILNKLHLFTKIN